MIPGSLWIAALPYWFVHTPVSVIEAWGGRVRTAVHDTLVSAWPGAYPVSKALRPVARIRYTPIAELSRTSFPYGDGRAVLEQIRVVEAHEAGFTGSGVRVGVLDAGFDASYPGIAHLFQSGQVVATYDFQSGDFLVVDTVVWPFFSENRFYIQDFDVSPEGWVVLAGATEDDLNLSTTAGWTLYLLAFTGTGWRPPVPLGTPREGFFAPRIVQRGDTFWVVAQQRQQQGVTSWWRVSGGDTLSVRSGGGWLFPSLALRGDTLWLVGLSPEEGGWVVERRRTDLSLLDRWVVRPFPASRVRNACFFLSEGWVLVGDTLWRVDTTGVEEFWTDVGNLTCGDGGAVAFTRREELHIRGEPVGFPVVGQPVGVTSSVVVMATPAGLVAYRLSDGARDTLLMGQGDRVRWRGNRWWIRRRGDPDVTPEPGITQHGSRMLSLIAGYAPGTWVGVAPGVEVVLARTERATADFEHQVEEDFWVAGLVWAASWGARVVSSSLGYGRAQSGTWYTPDQMDGETPVSSRVASVAARLWNVLVVTAMGNTPHASLPAEGDTSLVAPADARDILAVGGMDAQGQPVPNMGLGPTADGRIKPEVLAPYTATVPGPEGDLTISGTSVATALAAGVAALVLEAHPDLSALELRDVLIRTARPVEGYPVPSNLTGWGQIQAWPAVQEGTPAAAPEGLVLEVPYPHPVRRGTPRLVFPYRSDAPRLARLWIFRVDGVRVGVLEGLTLRVGRGEVVWSPPADLARGVYWAVLDTPDRRARTVFLVE